MNAQPLRTPNPILARLGKWLERAINHALSLDPETRQNIARLDGRRIGVELAPLNLALAITVDGDHLRVGPHWQDTRDLNLRASPASLLAFALRRGDESVLPPGKVEISGDAELARQFEKLMRDFRPDIEEAFAKTFGDVIGVPIAQAFTRSFTWAAESAKSLVVDAAGFVRDESGDAVAVAEAESFFDEVDDLRERTDRLDARVRRLQGARG